MNAHSYAMDTHSGLRIDPREAAGAVILHPVKKLILVGQNTYGGKWEAKWQMPQGGVDFGETDKHAAARELLEETGFDIPLSQFSPPSPSVFYDLPVRAHYTTIRRQNMRWFLARASSGKLPDAESVEDPTFAFLAWKSPKAVLKCCPFFQLEMYRQVFNHFGLL